MAEFQQAAASSRDYAATWRDQAGQVVATTYGGTMCLRPRLPARLRIEHDGYVHIIPCGECQGCLNYERLVLERRLCAHFDGQEPDLWIVSLPIPLDGQVPFCNRINRRPVLECESWWFRQSASSVAILARARAPLRRACKQLGVVARVAKVKYSRGRRAWRDLSVGLAVEREIWGENTKRYYARGLLPAEKETWTVARIAYQKGYFNTTSPRAWTADSLNLVPPEVLELRRQAKRGAVERSPRADLSENAQRILAQIYGTLPAPATRILSNAAPIGRPTKAELQAYYQRVAEQKAASALASSALKNLPHPSEDGGYKTSLHTTFAETPRLLTEEELLEPGPSGKPRWAERELEQLRLGAQRESETKAKVVAESMSIIERMAAKQKERDRGG